MKKLIVMVSAYRSGDWIENRLDNLCHSTLGNDQEVWVVNANSPDPRDDIVPQKFPVHYIKLDHDLGVYATWNHIIKESNGVYITNANTDDLIAPVGYERLIGFLDNRPSLGFVYPNWIVTDRPNLTWAQAQLEPDRSGKPGIYRGNLDKGGVGHFPLWRKRLHHKHGLFDERFRALGDADWWARCYYSGVHFQWCKDYLACYLWRGNTDNPNLWHRAVNEQEWELYHQKIASYRTK